MTMMVAAVAAEPMPTGRLRVVGVDPGPTPGLARLDFTDGVLVRAEVTQTAEPFVEAPALLARWTSVGPGCGLLVQVERFVEGPRAARTSTPAAADATRRVVAACLAVAPRARLRSAAQVKPWATDVRLRAARIAQPERGLGDLYALTRGRPHARDAARHALFAAVHDGHAPDPLIHRTTMREA